MLARNSRNYEDEIRGVLLTGDNFDCNKYFNDNLRLLGLNSKSKEEYKCEVEKIIKKENENYQRTSEQFVDKLLDHYKLFINIGKNIEKIETHLTQTETATRQYSSLLTDLRKDVESFNVNYTKYQKSIEDNIKKRQLKTELNPTFSDLKEDLEENKNEEFNIDDFLNPQKGSKNWLEEQPEKIRVLIEEKKYHEAVNLIQEIRKCDLEVVNYETKVEIDQVYNFMIEKLTINISKTNSTKDVKYYLQQLNQLGFTGLSISTFLNWISKKLKIRITKSMNQTEEKEAELKAIMDKKADSINLSNINNLKNISYVQRMETVNEADEEADNYKTENTNRDCNETQTNNVNLTGFPDDYSNLDETVNDLDISVIKQVKISPLQEIQGGMNSVNAGINLLHSGTITEKKITRIIEEYFVQLDKFMKVLDEYFHISSINNYSYSSYIVPWLNQEVRLMAKNIEIYFTKIQSISEIKKILRFLKEIFIKYDKKGVSPKYIFDIFFINNIKISLEALINYCMKVEGNSYELKEYSVTYKSQKIRLLCVSEIGNATFNVFQIVSEFITEFLEDKKNFIDLIFIEEYFFESILSRDFTTFIKNKISKNISSNLEVKAFFENSENMAIPNQILINYGISILSIENLLEFFFSIMAQEKQISYLSRESLKVMKDKINESKITFFSNLFKTKLENHFYNGLEMNKDKYKDDIISSEFKKPENIFYSYFFFLKSLAKTIRLRTNNDMKMVKYFVLDTLYVNFLKIIENIRDLDKIYDTELNFFKLGVNGLELIIYGIYFIYLAIQKIFLFDEENKFKNITEEFIDEFINEFGKTRNIIVEKFKKNKQMYQDNILKFIIENRIELVKGY